jgi:hypothetical protein
MIKHLELKLNPLRRVHVDSKTLSGVTKITSKPSANASGLLLHFSSTLEGFGIST